MKVDIEHHYGWTRHEVPPGVALDADAYAAVLETHAGVLTPDNHRRDGGHVGERSGSIAVRRLHDAPPISNPTLARMTEFFGGNKAGDYWFSCAYRLAFEDGDLAVDAKGRRWVFCRYGEGHRAGSTGPDRLGWECGSGDWYCATDPRECRDQTPGPDPRPRPPLYGSTSRAPEVPWVIGGRATEEERQLVQRMRFDAHLLSVVCEVEIGARTLTQAAAAVKSGRGQAGRDALDYRVRRLLARLRGEETLVTDIDPERARRELIAAVGLTAQVELERAERLDRVARRRSA